MTRERRPFAVFGFDSTHDALVAENALLAEDIEVALIPTPRALGSLCGFAVRVPLGQRDASAAILASARIVPMGEIGIEDRG